MTEHLNVGVRTTGVESTGIAESGVESNGIAEKKQQEVQPQ